MRQIRGPVTSSHQPDVRPNRTIRPLIATLITVVLAGGVLLLVMRTFEPQLIFHPLRYPAGIWEPSALGIEADDVEFTAADGVSLHGWWVPAGEAAVRRGGIGDRDEVGRREPVILWCHGNAGNLTGRGPEAGEMAARGASVLLFDYRGYGRSEGRPTEEGIYRDAEAAYRYLVEERGIPPDRIVLLGRSLGAAPAARLASTVDHAGLVLVSPFPDAASMARRMFFGLPVGRFAAARFPVAEWVAERDRPLLVMHGEADRIVPLELGRRVYAAAAEPKRLVVLERAGHNDIHRAAGEVYLDGLVGFAFEAVEAAGPGPWTQR